MHDVNAPDSIISVYKNKISEEENSKLSQELYEWRDKATAESEHRQLTKEEIRRLYKTRQQLQDQVQDYAVIINYLRSIISKCAQELDRVLPILEELKTGISLRSSQY